MRRILWFQLIESRVNKQRLASGRGGNKFYYQSATNKFPPAESRASCVTTLNAADAPTPLLSPLPPATNCAHDKRVAKSKMSRGVTQIVDKLLSIKHRCDKTRNCSLSDMVHAIRTAEKNVPVSIRYRYCKMRKGSIAIHAQVKLGAISSNDYPDRATNDLFQTASEKRRKETPTLG